MPYRARCFVPLSGSARLACMYTACREECPYVAGGVSEEIADLVAVVLCPTGGAELRRERGLWVCSEVGRGGCYQGCPAE